MDINIISNIIKLCSEKYNKHQFDHVIRVAEYAINNPIVSRTQQDNLFITALCHDLIEDTNTTYEELENALNIKGPNEIIKAIMLLTHLKETNDYNSYIQKIRSSKNLLAYCVKLADMKDHLCQTNTLTNKLKEKYWDAIPYLL